MLDITSHGYRLHLAAEVAKVHKTYQFPVNNTKVKSYHKC